MPLFTHRRAAQSASGDLVQRLHNTSLDTPNTLSSRYDVSNPNVDAESSSSSDCETYPRKKTRPVQHTRSASHPFPALFGNRRGRQGSVNVAREDPDLSDNDTTMRRQSVQTHSRASTAGGRDFETGNCMTCGSLMRWPRDLKLFKCTICVTVNDLTAVEAAGDAGKLPVDIRFAEERLIRY
jgi:E3 ubiquitin-protein ligase HECTD2